MKRLSVLLLFLAAFQPVIQAQSEKPYRYVLYSLAVPGLGEYFMGETGQAKVFFGSEAILWLSAWSLSSYSEHLYDNAVSLAKSEAGISGKIHSRKYLLALGDYHTIADYNADMRLQRTPAFQFPENDPAYFWEWTDLETRKEFKRHRQYSDAVDYSVQFVVGAVVINHAVSAFNVVRLIRTKNAGTPEPQPDTGFKMDAVPTDPFTGDFGDGIQVNLSWSW